MIKNCNESPTTSPRFLRKDLEKVITRRSEIVNKLEDGTAIHSSETQTPSAMLLFSSVQSLVLLCRLMNQARTVVTMQKLTIVIIIVNFHPGHR